jgi:hypothetical protein
MYCRTKAWKNPAEIRYFPNTLIFKNGERKADLGIQKLGPREIVSQALSKARSNPHH